MWILCVQVRCLGVPCHLALCGVSFRGLGRLHWRTCGQLSPAPRRTRPLHSLGWKLGWVAQVRPILLLEALRLLRPSPRVLSLTGSDPQDPREELGVPAPSPFPARLACIAKLEKQFPQTLPSLRAQPRSTSGFCGPGTGVRCPSPRLPAPLTLPPDAVLASPLLVPLRARPPGPRPPESRGLPPYVQVGEPWSRARAAGWEWNMGAHSKSQFAKTMSRAHGCQPPHKGKNAIPQAFQARRPVAQSRATPDFCAAGRIFRGLWAEPPTGAPSKPCILFGFCFFFLSSNWAPSCELTLTPTPALGSA